MNRTIALLALLVMAAPVAAESSVLTELSWRRRVAERELRKYLRGADRFVDMGVTLRTVVGDPNGDELVLGKPRVRMLRERHYGGIVDTKTIRPQFVRRSENPVVWYCSEQQEAIVLHPDDSPRGLLAYGSEGAGKTRALAMWHGLRVLEHLGERREGGQTAPTDTRLGFVRQEFSALFPKNWCHHLSFADLYIFCDGTRIQLVSTYRQSKSQGSPIQGFNWSWCGRDEGQDQVDVHEDIQSRGRAARDGGEYYKQLITATAKDDTAWRTLRDKLVGSGRWKKQSLSIFFSPFVGKEFLKDKEDTMDPREFRRRYGDPITGEVDDLTPELSVYYNWARDRNVRPRPRMAIDVTAAILSDFSSYLAPGAPLVMVGGHDPGVIWNTTELLRLLLIDDRPWWVVVGELQTKQTTSRQHFATLRELLQTAYGIQRDVPDRMGNLRPDPEGGRIAVFCDPHGKGEGDTDYQTVYMAAQKERIDVFSPSTKKIRRSARIGMMNRLLLAGGGSRFAVALNDRGEPVAPVLVESFETLKKKPGDDNPEGTQRKDETDRTHAPAAAAYGVWPFEQEAFTENTVRLALAAARRDHR